ncbi:NUDIX hydrolase [Yoonia sp. 2307UL14-13]|uniref:NUDIX hydrolase n=1 Tax=Yoonia sp. 2307UL14-13 TaxID=3126506 RepID=UPI00309BC3D3
MAINLGPDKLRHRACRCAFAIDKLRHNRELTHFESGTMVQMPVRQLPLKFQTKHKTDIRAQFAALCWRVKNGKIQVCLVTSRTRKRWIIPKGWPMRDQTPALAAATEAFEEAGLSGHAIDHCLGIYTYSKPLDRRMTPVVAMVYPVQVRKVHNTWPEKGERKRKWFTPKKAAKKLTEPQLKRIVAGFTPHQLPKSS